MSAINKYEKNADQIYCKKTHMNEKGTTMVLNDIAYEYTELMNLIHENEEEGSFISHALKMNESTSKNLNSMINTYLASQKRDSDKMALTNEMNKFEKKYSTRIAEMNKELTSVMRMLYKIEDSKFESALVRKNSGYLYDELNGLINIVNEYVSCVVGGSSGTSDISNLLGRVNSFARCYSQIKSDYDTILIAESELLEKTPLDGSPVDEVYELDIRSYRENSDLVSFADDLKLLADCFDALERIYAPSSVGKNIYISKIESGSLLAKMTSKIDLSFFPRLIESTASAVRTWRMTPYEQREKEAETEKKKAETELIREQAEELRIKNLGSTMAIVTSMTATTKEMLPLENSEKIDEELMQKFLYKFLVYVERNPKGKINGIPYDLSADVSLLENFDERKSG